MNKVALEGTIHYVENRTTSTGGLMTRAKLWVEGAGYIPLLCWESEEFGALPEGATLRISGALHVYRWRTEDGENRSRMDVLVQGWDILGGPDDAADDDDDEPPPPPPSRKGKAEPPRKLAGPRVTPRGGGKIIPF